MNVENLGAQGRAHQRQLEACLCGGKISQRDIEIQLCLVQLDLAGQRGPVEILLPGHFVARIGDYGVQPGHFRTAQVVTVETGNNLVLFHPVSFGNPQGLDDGTRYSAAGRPGELHHAILGLQPAEARYHALFGDGAKRENNRNDR